MLCCAPAPSFQCVSVCVSPTKPKASYTIIGHEANCRINAHSPYFMENIKMFVISHLKSFQILWASSKNLCVRDQRILKNAQPQCGAVISLKQHLLHKPRHRYYHNNISLVAYIFIIFWILVENWSHLGQLATTMLFFIHIFFLCVLLVLYLNGNILGFFTALDLSDKALAFYCYRTKISLFFMKGSVPV